MNVIAQLSAALAALIVIAVCPLEAFLIERPWVQRFLGIESHGIANVHLWSFCLGTRNALAGAITLTGLWFVNFNDVPTGTIIVVIGCCYMLLASLAMGLADLLGYWRPRGGSIKGTIASSTLPAAALITIAISGWPSF
jgi:putative membrane protein